MMWLKYIINRFFKIIAENTLGEWSREGLLKTRINFNQSQDLETQVIWSGIYDWELPNRHQEAKVQQAKTNLNLPQMFKIKIFQGRQKEETKRKKIALTG